MVNLDVVIFGGGGAGLWLLDELHRQGYRVLLLEANSLGKGQTVGAQGIIHGGLKYTLRGLFTGSADAIKQMPEVWQRSLSGKGNPDLSETRVRAEYVHLWHTQSITSRAGMFAAKSLLKVQPTEVAVDDRPAALRGCDSRVYRLDEQVISPASFLGNLAGRHSERILKIDAAGGLSFDVTEAGRVEAIRLSHPETDNRVELRAGTVVFTAGEGNAELRRLVGLSAETMQRRPLHMVMVKGGLPAFNGHCVDGNKTRVTITSDTTSHSETVWQVGGQIAEDGVTMDPEPLTALAKIELSEVLGEVDLEGLLWSTYRVDRAEAVTAGGVRPDRAQVMREGNVVTGWPTKLALVPELAKSILSYLGEPGRGEGSDLSAIDGWPRPEVAQPPWEVQDQWHKHG